jgi:glycosyltransferase involved in cell wall biosynthesis
MNGERPVRVAFVVHVMQVAGAEVLVRETIHRLGRRIEPTIFCLDAIGTIGEELRLEGVPVVCLERRNHGRDFGVSRRMARELLDRRVEVVHAHQYTPFFYAALAKPLAGFSFRLIQTEHGRHYPDLVSPLRRAANRLVFDRLADAVNACCLASARAMNRLDGFRGHRIEIIDNGIELPRYSPAEPRTDLRRRLGLDPQRRFIACVARFHPVKDHPMLIRAMARVAAELPDVDLLLAGDGPDRTLLEDLCRELRIADRVRFLGVRKDVPDVLLASDLFALTSETEAASLTLMEAMACGLPVVVTDVGGNPELVRPGRDGLLVPRGDDAACARALLAILRDPSLARRFGDSGRERAAERFDIDRTISRYHQLYRRLSGRHSSA